MRILIGNDNNGAHLYERMGWLNTLVSCGHTCYLWNIKNEPAHKVFDSFEPQLFIFQSYNLNRVIIEAISERPYLKCIMKAGEWGKFSETKNLSNYQILLASKEEKDNVFKLKELTGQPEYLYIYYHEDDIGNTHGFWSDNGINIKSHMLAADICSYGLGRKTEEFESDITFIGGYWPYKARVLEKYIIPLCRSNQYRIKIFGGSVWPTPYYCGFLHEKYIQHALSSAAICPNLHEPHSQDFGIDFNERTFKLVANKCFVISDFVLGLRRIFNEDELIMARNPDEFKIMIEHYLKYPNEKIHYINRAYHKVIKEHTYFDRVSDMFKNLGYQDESEKCLQHKTKKIS